VIRAGIQLAIAIPDTHGNAKALAPELYQFWDKVAATAAENMPSVGMER